MALKIARDRQRAYPRGRGRESSVTWTLFFQLAMLITLTVVLVGTATESIVKEWKRDE